MIDHAHRSARYYLSGRCKTCRGNPALHAAQCDEVRSAKDALSFSVELLGRWRTMLRKPLLKTGGKEEKCAANQVVSRKDVLSEAMRLFLLEALHHTEEAPWQQCCPSSLPGGGCTVPFGVWLGRQSPRLCLLDMSARANRSPSPLPPGRHFCVMCWLS